jgi:hypothetical protein
MRADATTVATTQTVSCGTVAHADDVVCLQPHKNTIMAKCYRVFKKNLASFTRTQARA